MAAYTLQYLKTLARQCNYDALAWSVMKYNIPALDFYHDQGNFPNFISANELCDENQKWRPDMCARSPPRLSVLLLLQPVTLCSRPPRLQCFV